MQKVVFQPEPQNKSDVTWLDKDGNMYRLHSVFLENRSSVFREIDWTAEPVIESPYSKDVCLAFFSLCYSEYLIPKTAESADWNALVSLWQMCHQYKVEWEIYCVQTIVEGLEKNTVPREHLLCIVETATMLSNEDVLAAAQLYIQVFGCDASFISNVNSKFKDRFLQSVFTLPREISCRSWNNEYVRAHLIAKIENKCIVRFVENGEYAILDEDDVTFRL